MKRAALLRLTAGVLALGLCCALAGCGSDAPRIEATPAPSPTATPLPTAEPEQTAFTLPCYPEAGFHPFTGSNRTNLSLGGLIYEGLFELDGSFEPQNLLCSSYTVSEDGLTWTFALRGGVTFSDGSPLTAAEAAASLNAARNSALYSARLAGIRSVAASDGAVTLVLNTPNGGLPALLDIPIVKDGGGSLPLGTGPYVLSGAGESLSLTARSGWWQGRSLPVDVIPLRAIQAVGDLIHAFDTREITLVATDLTGTNTLGFSGSYETTDYPTSVMLYVGFNCTSGLCRDQSVRQALQRSMDRSAVSTALLSRHARPADLPVAPESALYDAALVDTLSYSPQAAEETLAAAGWSKADGIYTKGHQSMQLTLLTSTDNVDKLAVAEYLARSLTQAGFAVTLEQLPWEEYLTALGQGAFDLYLGEVRMTADFDPTALLSPDGALNYGGYSDQTAVQRLAALRAARGEERSAAAQALYQRLAEQPAFAVLCFKNWSVLTQWRQVSGLTPTQQNVFYGFADWAVGP